VRGLRGLCRAALFAAVFLVLLPMGAAAEALQADLDGDGVRDQVIRGSQPNDLCVVLSRTLQPQRLRLLQPIIRFTTADVDHDGDHDIIAMTAQAGLDIFLNTGRGRFRAVHAPVVHHWQRSPRLGAGPGRPQTENLSDAPPGSPAVRRVSLRGLSPARLLRPIPGTFAVRQLPRGIDLRGPPPLSF
jgi:hypothetical protein